MTWSIVARDPGGALGVAVASRFFAVGVLCAHARTGAGALATQALVNPGYGPAGLDLLAQGVSPARVVESPVRWSLTSAIIGSGHQERNDAVDFELGIGSHGELDRDEPLDHISLDVTAQPSPEPERGQITADHRRKLHDRIAEHITRERARGQLVDQTTASHDEDRHEQQRHMHTRQLSHGSQTR